MKLYKLRNWLETNQHTVDTNAFISFLQISVLFFISHQARAIILLYVVCSRSGGGIFTIARLLLRSKYHIECSTKEIGMNFMLPHPFNIIISAESIGDNVQINQNVTIGGNMKKTCVRSDGYEQKLPRIGNNVVIYTNAIVGGPVVIGDNVIIGANCTCTHDVDSNTMLYSCCKTSIKKIEVIPGSYKEI